MENAGRILLMPKGDYSAGTTYTMLDIVNHSGASWVCKQACTGQTPSDSNTAYWQRVGIAVDLANYLPLTGGKIENSNPHALGVGNTASDLVLPYYRGVSGLLGYLGFNGENNPIFATKAGLLRPLLHSMNYSDYALPLTGGTVGDGTKAYPLNVRGSSSYSLIDYMNDANDVRWGSLGFRGAENPIFLSGDRTNAYHLLHTGNKPTGTYTGNGDTTARTISIGGVGGVLCIRSNANVIAFVTIIGAVVFHSTEGMIWLTDSEISYNGDLKLSTSNTYLNNSGSSYTYYTL